MLDSHRAFQTLGDNIRAIRIRLKISQEELADRAGVHRTYLGAIERGERNVSLANIVKIANSLGVKPEKIMKGIK